MPLRYRRRSDTRPPHFQLRPGTIDESVYRAVVEENVYRLSERLSPLGVVLDVGAHIGCFSWSCWVRGATRIEAFEPDRENAKIARQNLKPTSVAVRRLAVWRSDRGHGVLRYSGYTKMLPDGPDPVGVNTGGGDVFAQSGPRIKTVGLDQIIADREISILKLDCEGSEYPILLTSKKLKQVRAIIGEYHLKKMIPSFARVPGIDSYSVGTLAELFARLRFKVEFVPYPDPRFSSCVGSFFAYNLD